MELRKRKLFEKYREINSDEKKKPLTKESKSISHEIKLSKKITVSKKCAGVSPESSVSAEHITVTKAVCAASKCHRRAIKKNHQANF